MTHALATLFGTNATPAIKEAVEFIFEIVPHKRGHCFIAIPISTQPLFDQWVAAHRGEFERDFLERRESIYQGIAVPNKDSGFFCAILMDRKEIIEDFLKSMNLSGTEDYLIIRKENRLRLSATPPPPALNDH